MWQHALHRNQPSVVGASLFLLSYEFLNKVLPTNLLYQKFSVLLIQCTLLLNLTMHCTCKCMSLPFNRKEHNCSKRHEELLTDKKIKYSIRIYQIKKKHNLYQKINACAELSLRFLVAG